MIDVLNNISKWEQARERIYTRLKIRLVGSF